MTRTTHTFVVLDLSSAAFAEISRKLKDAGYHHAFSEDDGRDVIDMQGIAVASDGSTPTLMPPDHWVMAIGENVQPATFPSIGALMPGFDGHVVTRESLKAAARFAIRTATRNGTALDFDPDALVIDLQNAVCGYRANLGMLAKESAEC